MGPLNNSRSTQRRPKLFVFCAHPVVQAQLLRLLKRSPFEVVASGELRPLKPELPNAAAQASVVIIDGDDIKSTLEFVCTLRMMQTAARLLVLLPSLDDSLTYPMLRLGVKGLVTYGQVPRVLAQAAAQVAAGGYWVPRDLLSRFLESILPELHGAKPIDPEVTISRRQREVLELLLENLSNKEIAARLFVSERTVKFHVSNLLSKFGVQRRADLIIRWMQRARDFPWQLQSPAKPLSSHVN